MLRVTTLYASSAGATARYYTQYLTQAPGEEPGRWLGSQAAELGLSGRVSTDALELLLAGRDPTSGTPLGRVLKDRRLADGRLVRGGGRVRCHVVGSEVVVGVVGVDW
jgi:hypothetical protein